MFRSREIALVLVLGNLAGSAGCVPFLVPPVRMRAGVGAAEKGHPLPDRGRVDASQREAPARTTSAASDGVLTEVAFALHPLDVVEDQLNNPLDVGLGYRVEAMTIADETGDHRLQHGPELELGYYPFRTEKARFGLFTELALLTPEGQSGKWGSGVTLGTSAELTGFSDGTFSKQDEDGSVMGVSHGRWALGLYAAASHRRVEAGNDLRATFGLSVRIPLLAGIACCELPGSSDDSSSASVVSVGGSEKRSRTEQRPRHAPREYTPAKPRRAD